MQVEFILWELREKFPAVWAELLAGGDEDLDRLTDLVCSKYEMPAINNFAARREYAHQLRDLIPSDCPALPEAPADDALNTAVVGMLQLCMATGGYWPWDRINGEKNAAFRAAIVEYAADVARM